MKNLLAMLLLALAFIGSAFAQEQKPLSRVQVYDLIAGGLDSERIAKAVSERGIDFDPTDEDLSTLRAKGATQALVDALRAATPTPLSKSAIIHLLSGAPSDETLADMVQRRGLDFAASEQDLDTLRIAGAGPLSLDAVRHPPFVLPPSSPQDKAKASEGWYDVGGNITAPIPIYSPDPGYTDEARKANLSGKVVVVAIIDAQGNVVDVQVLKSLGHGLDEKAVETVRQWKFKPAMRNGVPVKVRVNIEVTFRLLYRPVPNSAPIPGTTNQGQLQSRAEHDSQAVMGKVGGTLYVKAVAYRAIPYESTAYFQTAGHSNTSCYGSGSAYGYLSTVEVNCQTVTTPPTVIPVTIRKVDVYNQVEAGGMMYTIECSAHWVGSGCSWLLPGETFEADVKGTTMWVNGRKGGNMGKSVRPKFRILDVRPTQ